MANNLPFLDPRIPIVDARGNPTPQFNRWFQENISKILGAQTTADGAAPKTRIIGTGAGLSGGGDLSADRTIVIPAQAGVAAGSYGDATHAVQLTVDARGIITAISVAAISGGGGASWDFVPPTAASFPNLTSGDATQLTVTDDVNVGLIINTPTVAGEVSRMCTKALPAAGIDWTVIAKTTANIFPTNYIESGIFLHESASNKVMTHGLGYESQYILGTRLCTLTGFRATPRTAGSGMFSSGVPLWLRVRYVTSSNTYFTDYSRNGKTWINFTSVAAATGFTTRADRVGLGVTLISTAAPTFDMTCGYWNQSF